MLGLLGLLGLFAHLVRGRGRGRGRVVLGLLGSTVPISRRLLANPN